MDAARLKPPPVSAFSAEVLKQKLAQIEADGGSAIAALEVLAENERRTQLDEFRFANWVIELESEGSPEALIAVRQAKIERGYPVTEAEMFNGDPEEVYFPAGWMKRYAEILCRTYAEKISSPMQTVVIRPSNVYGPYDKFDFAVSHVTAALLRRVVERQSPLEVWGTGDDIRDLIHVDDFVDGVRDTLHRANHRHRVAADRRIHRDLGRQTSK